MRVKLGATTRKQTRGVQEIDALKLVVHEHYDPSIHAREAENDIGLIMLSKRYKRG